LGWKKTQINRKSKKPIFKRRGNIIQIRCLKLSNTSLVSQKLMKFLVTQVKELSMMKKASPMKTSLLFRLDLLKSICLLCFCKLSYFILSLTIEIRLSCIGSFGYLGYYMLYKRNSLEGACPVDHSDRKDMVKLQRK
jgi:hypothetical protein